MDMFTIQDPKMKMGSNHVIPSKNLSPRVLVVEDEAEIRGLIVLHLRREGYLVDEAGDGDIARKMLESQTYALAVVDWMLPGASGVEITRFIRSRPATAKMPVLFVTAKAEPEDVIRGLEAGADDYMTKPFDNTILLARVKALLRRQSWLSEVQETSAAALIAGPLKMNTETYEVELDGQSLELTRSEFRLLQALLEHQGRVLARERLIEEIQGEGVNVVGRTVDTHVFGLRKKLGAFSDMIETIRGVGYRVKFFNPPD